MAFVTSASFLGWAATIGSAAEAVGSVLGGSGGGGIGSVLGMGGGGGGGLLSTIGGIESIMQGVGMMGASKNADPYGPYRANAASQLSSLSSDPSSIMKNPGYQFGMQQGEQALTRSLASGGYLGSGNAAIALEQYGQTYAGQMLSQEQARLANLAGANQSPAQGAVAGAGMNNMGWGQIGSGIGQLFGSHP